MMIIINTGYQIIRFSFIPTRVRKPTRSGNKRLKFQKMVKSFKTTEGYSKIQTYATTRDIVIYNNIKVDNIISILGNPET